ncbi:uncharacterized protein LDX57_001867 [Aspergillus melleus]|uniref:uncharacterized protein n=1 Tax=Aspergillus melleus TaxID=138277 RepID=UPI001E8E68DF|nr:uncharacterized protein LDX57_001867 [Aspergillus melleus]KAH8424113.1 hypothetical protein LDX57_001867 [Aspergillus melleus]
MTPCDNTNTSTTWCCGNTTDCCGTPDAITIAPVLGEHISIPTPTSYASSSTTTDIAIPAATSTFTHTTEPTPSNPTTTSSISIATTTSTPSTTQTQPSSPTETTQPEEGLPGLSNGVKAGIGVSVSVAVLIIFVAAAFLLRRLRRPKVVVEREFVSSVALTPTSMPMPIMPMGGLRGEGREVIHGSLGGRPGGSGNEGYIREDGVGRVFM